MEWRTVTLFENEFKVDFQFPHLLELYSRAIDL